MVHICPIENKTSNEKIVRLNALLTFLTISAFLVTRHEALPAILLIDFLLRGFFNGKFSLFKTLSMFIVKTLHLKEQKVNAGPKIFAARIGSVFSLAILLFSLVQADSAATGAALILAFFSFLEFSAGFCVACKIYPYTAFLRKKQNFSGLY